MHISEDRNRNGDPAPVEPDPPASKPTAEPGAARTALALLQAWMKTLVIPVPLTLAAFVFTAFLLFPAYKGLSSGSTIRQLEQAIEGLEKQKNAAQLRTIELERDLAGRDLQLTQRQRQAEVDTGSGLYLSPLLFLDGKKGKAPDLISIDFTQADQAVLVFSLPKLDLREIEVSIYQETRLVWNQTLAVPKQRLFGENLVTLLLKSAALGKGNYRMTLQGDAAGQRVALSQFDIAIES